MGSRGAVHLFGAFMLLVALVELRLALPLFQSDFAAASSWANSAAQHFDFAQNEPRCDHTAAVVETKRPRCSARTLRKLAQATCPLQEWQLNTRERNKDLPVGERLGLLESRITSQSGVRAPVCLTVRRAVRVRRASPLTKLRDWIRPSGLFENI